MGRWKEGGRECACYTFNMGRRGGRRGRRRSKHTHAAAVDNKAGPCLPVQELHAVDMRQGAVHEQQHACRMHIAETCISILQDSTSCEEARDRISSLDPNDITTYVLHRLAYCWREVAAPLTFMLLSARQLLDEVGLCTERQACLSAAHSATPFVALQQLPDNASALFACRWLHVLQFYDKVITPDDFALGQLIMLITNNRRRCVFLDERYPAITPEFVSCQHCQLEKPVCAHHDIIIAADSFRFRGSWDALCALAEGIMRMPKSVRTIQQLMACPVLTADDCMDIGALMLYKCNSAIGQGTSFGIIVIEGLEEIARDVISAVVHHNISHSTVKPTTRVVSPCGRLQEMWLVAPGGSVAFERNSNRVAPKSALRLPCELRHVFAPCIGAIHASISTSSGSIHVFIHQMTQEPAQPICIATNQPLTRNCCDAVITILRDAFYKRLRPYDRLRDYHRPWVQMPRTNSTTEYHIRDHSRNRWPLHMRAYFLPRSSDGFRQ